MSAPLLPCCEPRLIRFSRWGLAEDPTRAIVTCGGQLYRVLRTYRREGPIPAVMLVVSHLNGESAGELAAGAVKILPEHFHEAMDTDDERDERRFCADCGKPGAILTPEDPLHPACLKGREQARMESEAEAFVARAYERWNETGRAR